ncbi:hypothetical protein [Microseira sp. BLCC-F43]|uniref:hypothetical protein n=1 Tax=Microseira sp. BLCC-F43 TaxID=3153602 RepID=UPI0035B961E3
MTRENGDTVTWERFLFRVIRRTSYHPTAEQLLAAVRDITLLPIDVPDRTYVHLTPRSPWQQRILSLWRFPLQIHTQLSVDDAIC